uniref:Putative DNA-binding transcriptional regulator n=1 Tax=Serratia marcescens TaxID=615 RepID=V5YUX2_SERMA|nr:putative DNA-binding transcriptional regulator [Serratia marcescens]
MREQARDFTQEPGFRLPHAVAPPGHDDVSFAAVLRPHHAQPPGFDIFLHHRVRHGRHPQPGQQRQTLVFNGAHRQALLLIQQLYGQHRAFASGIRHRDAAVFHAGHLGQRLRLLVDRMIRRGDINAHDLVQFAGVDLRRRAKMHVRRDHNVGAPLFQPLPGARQHFGENRHLGVGLQRQLVHQREQQAWRRQRFTDDGQVGFPTARQRLGVGGQLIGRLQQHPPALQQHAPDVGELGAVARTVEQHHVQFFFQFLHGVAERRRHPAQFVGGRGETATPVDRIHHSQRLKRERPISGHHIPLSGNLNMPTRLTG